ncbi:cleft lip and palate transmembrane protein 1-domain-containing protein [Syncephalis fuscata]|nr:cleft lip and palate transmembrane protein 1-domain-containing protein [Syncephalis fuscata]
MGKLTAALGIVPAILVAAYLAMLAINVLTLFKPTLSIPFVYELTGSTDASGRPLLPGNAPYLPADQSFRMALRLSTQEEPKRPEDSEHVWQSKLFQLDNATAFPIETEVSVALPVKYKKLAGDLYAHIYLYPIIAGQQQQDEQSDEDIEVADAHPELHTEWTVRQTINLVRYQPLIVKEDKLLMAATDTKSDTTKTKKSKKNKKNKKKSETTDSEVPVPHWVPRIQIDLLNDRTEYPRNAVPSDIHNYMLWVRYKDSYAYLPIMSPNPLLLGPDDLIPLEKDGKAATPQTLKLRVALTSLGWFRISRIMWSTLQAANGKGDGPSIGFRLSDGDVEQFRQMIANTDPLLLLATIVASVLHLLFEWLAFKEDVAHWSKLKNTAGVSKMAVVLEMVSRCVAVLFLWERRKDTSMIIIGGACVTAASEVWKVYRVLNAPPATVSTTTFEKQKVTKDSTTNTTNTSELQITEAERVSREADRQCRRTIGMACIPLMMGYAAWSLFYLKHTSFRAWAIDALMAAMYLLGFITLTPQLFLNYRLRSVAAMPLRVFLYRALNTFVDDLFALVIPMPNMTRIAAFRDDIVFFILLWQWWRYPSRKETEKLKEE